MRIGVLIAIVVLVIQPASPGLADDRWADLSGRVVCDFYEAPGPPSGFDSGKDPAFRFWHERFGNYTPEKLK